MGQIGKQWSSSGLEEWMIADRWNPPQFSAESNQVGDKDVGGQLGETSSTVAAIADESPE